MDGFGRLHAHGAGQCGLTAEEPTVDRTAWITYHALSWPPTSTRAGTWTLDQLLKEWPPEVICPAHGSGRDPARDGDPNHGTGPDRGPRGDAVPTIEIVPGVRPSNWVELDGRVGWAPADRRVQEPASVYLVDRGGEALPYDVGLPAHREAILGELRRVLRGRRLGIWRSWMVEPDSSGNAVACSMPSPCTGC